MDGCVKDSWEFGVGWEASPLPEREEPLQSGLNNVGGLAGEALWLRNILLD